MEALANLGIDGKLLLAQVVNFFILFFVLKKFAYRPMLAMMDERSKKIEKGLKDADRAEKRLKEIEEKEKEVLASARDEAKKLLAEASEAGKERDAAKIVETEARVKKLLADADMKLADDRARMIEQAKRELSETVVLAVEKILKEKMNGEQERELIEKEGV